MRLKGKLAFVAASLMALAAVAAYATLNNFQGFETNTGDWVASEAITRTHSGGGALHLPASSGNFYAELQNLHDGYAPGFGDGGFSFYGGADSVYHGDFFQSIDVYIDAAWAPAADQGDPDFWIDMTPYHADPNNFGAEHNFRLSATGAWINVTVDGQSAPIAAIANSGWYSFVMVYHKAPNPADPVITDMQIYDSGGNQVGSTRVFATSPGGPFASSDLRGNGYVWLTLWQNGFAGDVLGLDNVVTGLLPTQVKAEGQFDASTNPAAKDAKFNVNAKVDPKGKISGHAHYEDKAGNVMIEGDVTSIAANGPASVTVGGLTKGKNGGVAFTVTLDGGANTVFVTIAAHDSVPAYSAMGTLEKGHINF